MTDPGLLRTTLEALDLFVDGLRRGSTGVAGVVLPPHDATRLVIDEGRGAAEWALTVRAEGGVVDVRVVVVCEIANDRLTEARLYVALPSPA